MSESEVDPLLVEIGEKLRLARRCACPAKTLAEVSIDFGLSVAQISKIERGHVPCLTLLQVQAFCQYYGLCFAEVVFKASVTVQNASSDSESKKKKGPNPDRISDSIRKVFE